ncbi:MAG TPA: hypothetical protein VNQ14_11495, partial [Woeseiaceae bacterium]|nr:hypothetical protein [Woeseiaceae bacterium]
MKKAMQVLAGSSALAIPFAILIATALAGLPARSAAQASVQGNGQVQHVQGNSAKSSWQKHRIEGVWDAKVVITDCSSGNPIGPPFDALGVFERDGSFHDTNA